MTGSRSRATTQGLRLALVFPLSLVGLVFVVFGGTIMALVLVAVALFMTLGFLLLGGKVLLDRGAAVLWGFAIGLLGAIVLAEYGPIPWSVVDVLATPLDLLFAGSTYEPIVGGAIVLAALLGLLVWLVGVYEAFEIGLRTEPAVVLARTGAPITTEERRAATVVERLAMQIDLPVPAVRILDSQHPICYTIRYPWSSSPETVVEDSDTVAPGDGIPLEDVVPDGGSDADQLAGSTDTGSPELSSVGDVRDPTETDHVVVVSTGLLDRLPATELQAVLAHEVAHLTNGDLRLMNWLLLPVFWADAAETSLVPIPRWTTVPIRWTAVPAVAFFNRGREFIADAAAAELTGDPAALASALRRLDPGTASPPTSDFRAVALVNLLPTQYRSGDVRSSLPRSHPPTAERIERLEALAAERERI